MGHFDPWVDVYCQNDEVSPDVHVWLYAKGSSDTPRSRETSSLLGPIPHLTQREHSPDILNEPVFERFTGDYD